MTRKRPKKARNFSILGVLRLWIKPKKLKSKKSLSDPKNQGLKSQKPPLNQAKSTKNSLVFLIKKFSNSLILALSISVILSLTIFHDFLVGIAILALFIISQQSGRPFKNYFYKLKNRLLDSKQIISNYFLNLFFSIREKVGKSGEIIKVELEIEKEKKEIPKSIIKKKKRSFYKGIQNKLAREPKHFNNSFSKFSQRIFQVFINIKDGFRKLGKYFAKAYLFFAFFVLVITKGPKKITEKVSDQIKFSWKKIIRAKTKASSGLGTASKLTTNRLLIKPLKKLLLVLSSFSFRIKNRSRRFRNQIKNYLELKKQGIYREWRRNNKLVLVYSSTLIFLSIFQYLIFNDLITSSGLVILLIISLGIFKNYKSWFQTIRVKQDLAKQKIQRTAAPILSVKPDQYFKKTKKVIARKAPQMAVNNFDRFLAFRKTFRKIFPKIIFTFVLLLIAITLLYFNDFFILAISFLATSIVGLWQWQGRKRYYRKLRRAQVNQIIYLRRIRKLPRKLRRKLVSLGPLISRTSRIIFLGFFTLLGTATGIFFYDYLVLAATISLSLYFLFFVVITRRESKKLQISFRIKIQRLNLALYKISWQLSGVTRKRKANLIKSKGSLQIRFKRVSVFTRIILLRSQRLSVSGLNYLVKFLKYFKFSKKVITGKTGYSVSRTDWTLRSFVSDSKRLFRTRRYGLKIYSLKLKFYLLRLWVINFYRVVKIKNKAVWGVKKLPHELKYSIKRLSFLTLKGFKGSFFYFEKRVSKNYKLILLNLVFLAAISVSLIFYDLISFGIVCLLALFTWIYIWQKRALRIRQTSRYTKAKVIALKVQKEKAQLNLKVKKQRSNFAFYRISWKSVSFLKTIGDYSSKTKLSLGKRIKFFIISFKIIALKIFRLATYFLKTVVFALTKIKLAIKFSAGKVLAFFRTINLVTTGFGSSLIRLITLSFNITRLGAKFLVSKLQSAVLRIFTGIKNASALLKLFVLNTARLFITVPKVIIFLFKQIKLATRLSFRKILFALSKTKWKSGSALLSAKKSLLKTGGLFRVKQKVSLIFARAFFLKIQRLNLKSQRLFVVAVKKLLISLKLLRGTIGFLGANSKWYLRDFFGKDKKTLRALKIKIRVWSIKLKYLFIKAVVYSAHLVTKLAALIVKPISSSARVLVREVRLALFKSLKSIFSFPVKLIRKTVILPIRKIARKVRIPRPKIRLPKKSFTRLERARKPKVREVAKEVAEEEVVEEPPVVPKKKITLPKVPQIKLLLAKKPLVIASLLVLIVVGLVVSFINFGQIQKITPDTFRDISRPEQVEKERLAISDQICQENIEGLICEIEKITPIPEPEIITEEESLKFEDKLLAQGPISEPEGEVLGIKEDLEQRVVGAEGKSRAEYVAPPANPFGIFMATISLFFGFIFFLYSIKYYLTIAVILLFGRDKSNNNYNNNNHKNDSPGIFNNFIKNKGSNNGKGRLSNLFDFAFGNNNHKEGKSNNNLVKLPAKKQPFISIHLPFYNEKKVANRILMACTSFDYENYEVIVIDDSTDETIKILEKWKKHPRVKVIHRKERSGYKGGALKVALQEMDPQTEFVAIFDADFVPYPDSLIQFLGFFDSANQGLENYKKSNLAAVQGYQWHVLNKGENWITQAVRSEFSGSYVVERPGEEIVGSLKQIAGSVYLIRADILKSYGWTDSLTEDFELTMRLYRDGYEVLYTPYIQGPSECVATLKRLIRQRMRWAEGHTRNIRKYFWSLLRSKKPTFKSKIEFLYLAPYYLQSAFFLVGTLTWFISDVLMHTALPFWTSVWGWSLVFTNLLALPLMNSVGLFLEESERKDYAGIFSFVALTYLLVPFQAYAALKGLFRKERGTWFRTPKTGHITDDFFKVRSRFRKWFRTLFPGTRRPRARKSEQSLQTYLAQTSSYNNFRKFKVRRKSLPFGLGRAIIAGLLITGILLGSFASNIKFSLANPDTLVFADLWSTRVNLFDDSTNAYRALLETVPTTTSFAGVQTVSDNKHYAVDPTSTSACGTGENGGFENNSTSCWITTNAVIIQFNATNPSCTAGKTVLSSGAHDGTYALQMRDSCTGSGAIYMHGAVYLSANFADTGDMNRGWDVSGWLKSDNNSSGTANLDKAMAGLIVGYQYGAGPTQAYVDYMVNYIGIAPTGNSNDNSGNRHDWIYQEGKTAGGVSDTTWYQMKPSSSSTMRDIYVESGQTNPTINRVAFTTYIDRAANTNAAYLSVVVDTMDMSDGIDNLNFVSPQYAYDENWSAQTVASAAGYEYEYPAVGTDGTDAYVAYEEDSFVADDIKVSNVDGPDGSVDWTTNLTDGSGGTTNYPRIAVDSSGNSYIAWDRQSDTYVQKLNSSGTQQWTDEGINLTGAATGIRPDVAVDSSGNSYYVFDSGSSGIRIQKLNSSGTEQWTAGGVRVDTSTPGDFPEISLDSSGNSYVTWETKTTGDPNTWYIRAQKMNNPGSGDPSTQWTEVIVSKSTSGINRGMPDIATDSSGNSYITWYENGTDDTADQDVWAQALNSSGTAQWTTGGVEVTSDVTVNHVYPQIALDANDAPLIVFYSSYYNTFWGSVNDVFSVLLDATDGSEIGGHPWRLTQAELSRYPQIATSGSTAFVVWQKFETNDDVLISKATDYSWEMGTGNWQIDGAVTADYVANDQIDYSLDIVNNDGTTVDTNCNSGTWSSGTGGAQEFSISSISPGSCSSLDITDDRIRVNWNFNGTDKVPLTYHELSFTNDPGVTTGTIVPENVWAYIAIIPIIPFLVRWFRRRKLKGRKNPKPA